MIFLVFFQKGNSAAFIESSAAKREFVLACINLLFSRDFQLGASIVNPVDRSYYCKS
jgi:hypothetical protein